MTSSRYITPRLGPRTAAAVALICLAAHGLMLQQSRRWSTLELDSQLLGKGVIYGLLCAGCWVITALPTMRLFHAARVAVVLLSAAWMVAESANLDARWNLEKNGWIVNETADLIYKYFIYFGGLAVGCGAAASLWGLPRWRSVNSNRSVPFRRWTVGDLAATTSLLAITFAVGRLYRPPIPPVMFWPVLIAFWLLLPVCCCFVMQAIVGRGWRALAGTSVALLLAIAIAFGLAICTIILDEAWDRSALPRLVTDYGCLIGGCLLALSLVGIAGRSDALKAATP